MDGPARNELNGDVHGNAVQAGTINTVIINAGPVKLQVPQMLPAETRHFLNRGAELKKLESAPAPRWTAVTGPPGMGKTTLVTHWARTVRATFPDG